MKTAYHQSIKRRQKRKKDKHTNKKVKVFPKVMSKDYTIYTKCKQTKAKKLKMRLRNKEHKVNALVIRAEEGRGKLRKAMIRSKHPLQS